MYLTKVQQSRWQTYPQTNQDDAEQLSMMADQSHECYIFTGQLLAMMKGSVRLHHHERVP
jgi:hypothetical protein